MNDISSAKGAIKLSLHFYRRRIWAMQITFEFLYIFIFASPVLRHSESLGIVFLKPDSAKAKILKLLPI